VAIQKKADDYDKDVGCKWDLQSLKVRANWAFDMEPFCM